MNRRTVLALLPALTTVQSLSLEPKHHTTDWISAGPYGILRYTLINGIPVSVEGYTRTQNGIVPFRKNVPRGT